MAARPRGWHDEVGDPACAEGARVCRTVAAGADADRGRRAERESESIRIELKRGALSINVLWPRSAAGDFALWLRELLR